VLEQADDLEAAVLSAVHQLTAFARDLDEARRG